MIDEIIDHENCSAYEKYQDLPVYSASDGECDDLSPDQRRYYQEKSCKELFAWKRTNLDLINHCVDCQKNLSETFDELESLFYVKPQGYISRTRYYQKLTEIFEYDPRFNQLRKISLPEIWTDSSWIKSSGFNREGNRYFKFDWNDYTESYKYFVTVSSSVKWWKIVVIKEEINRKYFYQSFALRNGSSKIIFLDSSQIKSGYKL